MKFFKKLYVLLCWLTATRWLVHLVLSRIEELTLFWAEACGWMAESRAGQIVLSWEFLPALEEFLVNVWAFCLTPGLVLVVGIQAVKFIRKNFANVRPSSRSASAQIKEKGREIEKRAKAKDGYCATVSFPDEVNQFYYDVGEQKEGQFVFAGKTYRLLFENDSTPYLCIFKDQERQASLGIGEIVKIDGLFIEFSHDIVT